jgi:AraC family transcriptional regulator
MPPRIRRGPADDLSNLADLDCLGRVHRAIDHITANLHRPLRLETVAKVACFSPYHFHRVFRAIVGETLREFVERVRLERALYLMSHGPRPPLTEIALTCGFGSSSSFSRSFRARFGVPPSAFDLDAYRQSRRSEMVATLPELAPLTERANPDGFVVRLRELPARRVFYRRVLRPYEGDRVRRAAAQLVEWARERDLDGGQWLGYQWDEPEIVPLHRCRYDVAVEVPDDAVASEGIGVVRFPPMLVGELDVIGPIELEVRALDWLYGAWLPRSGFAPDHQPVFESWIGEPFGHGDTHFELRVQLPVVKARGAGW